MASNLPSPFEPLLLHVRLFSPHISSCSPAAVAAAVVVVVEVASGAQRQACCLVKVSVCI